MLQCFLGKGCYMHPAQDDFRPLGSKTVGDKVRVGHVVGLTHDQCQVTPFSIRNRFVGFVHESDIKFIRGKGGDHGKTDRGVSKKRQFDAESRIAGL